MQGTLKTFKTGSQCAKILAYLQVKDNYLTVEMARMLRYGSNCRSRISDLENAGHKIKHDRIKFNGGYVAKYSLVV